MAKIIHLRCHRCGEQLSDREREYCPPCNLYLAYRAMPLILGMILTGHLSAGLRPCGSDQLAVDSAETLSYEDDTALIWE